MKNQPEAILALYGFEKNKFLIEPLGNGLINTTWKVIAGEECFVLQKINDTIFANPFDIDFNTSRIGEYITNYHPDYFFVNPLPALNGKTMVYEKGIGYFRLFNYVSNSKTIQTVEKPEQAYEAAQQFAKFTATVSAFDYRQLKITIPSFHDLSLRYKQFCNALKIGNEKRIKEATESIADVQTFHFIVQQFEQIKKDVAFKQRTMHHDTKISNVLFDADNQGICVIDLDTIMPGYFFSDVGDMMRTYLSPVNEEENDFSKIEIRDAFYKAIVQGYFAAMKNELTTEEKNHFFYAGEFMIYMQAIRFLTDYLQHNSYYQIEYPEQNLQRAKNQFVLLKKYVEKESSLRKMN